MPMTHSNSLLLRTILGVKTDMVFNAWEQWINEVKDPVEHIRKDTTGLRRLLPLLLIAIRRNSLTADSAFLTVLKSAYFREELRDRTYRRILASILSAFHAEGIEAILLNGAAYAHSVYPETWLRHCHNIDLYCNKGHAGRATKLLAKLACRETVSDGELTGFEHETGLPVELHQRLLAPVDVDQTFAAAYERTLELPIDGNPARVLVAEDALLQICAHGLDDGIASHPGLACDAWMLVRHDPELDRDALYKEAAGAGIVDNLGMIMTYLSGELEAPPAARVVSPVIYVAQTNQ